MKRLVVALLFLGGLAATLALPGRPAPLPSDQEVAFAILVEGTEKDTLAPAEREARLATLRALGPAALARFLEGAVAKGPGDVPRRVALECLADCATAREVGALMRLASLDRATPDHSAPDHASDDAVSGDFAPDDFTSEQAATTPPLGSALRTALRATLERDARAFRELVPAWRSARESLRPELLGAVAERGDPAGLEFLTWVATFEGESHHRALAEAAVAITPAAPGAEAREHLETLCALLRSPDTVCVQKISAALARARVEAAIPAWIELLGSESRGTRERALRSLTQVTGLALGQTVERWQAWYEAEVTWLEEQAPDQFAQLESDDDAVVLTALRALSQRRLARDELAQAIEPLLDHPTVAVRLCACAALETLASQSVVPALVAALEDEDESVARAVWSTLRVLTALDLPFDPPLWRERLATP